MTPRIALGLVGILALYCIAVATKLVHDDSRYTRPSIGQTTSDCSKLFKTDAFRSYTEIDEAGNTIETRTYVFNSITVYLTFVDGRLAYIREVSL